MQKNNIKFLLIGLCSITFMIIVLYLNYLYAVNLGKDYQGIFGDMFGASNALFTGLSFTGLIITILLQRQEIKDTKNEVQKQAGIISLQQFENTLFTLISCHHQIIGDLRSDSYALKNGKKIYTYFEGRKVFESLVGIIFNNIENEADTFNIKFAKLYEGLGNKYLHYVRNLFQIIKIIDEYRFNYDENINTKEKNKYIGIIWQQLSDHEITLIFYNCAYEKENPEYKKLIEKYALMENTREIFIHEEIKNLYSKDAFKIKC
jgi:hypothetical protein